MKFRFDSKTVSLQAPSGLLLGLIVVLLARFLHLPLVPTRLSVLVCLIIFVDLLHFIGKIDVDISNLCQRTKSLRKTANDNIPTILRSYLEEHVVFLIGLAVPLFVGRLIFARR
jgi:hypothetical protein